MKRTFACPLEHNGNGQIDHSRLCPRTNGIKARIIEYHDGDITCSLGYTSCTKTYRDLLQLIENMGK